MIVCAADGINIAENNTQQPDFITDELQIKENLANEKYTILLRNWAYEPEYIDDVEADFPSFYGGAYINSNRDLVIQVTSAIDDVKDYFSEMVDLTNVILDEVQFSYASLKAEKKAIADLMDPYSDDSYVSSISGVGISFPENAVTLYVYTEEEGEEAVIFAQRVKNYVSSFSNIKVIITNERDETCVSVSPGSRISNRSVGFWAYKGNVLGLITAPHSTISSGDTIMIGSTTFGTAGTPYFSGNVDAVFIGRTNTSFTISSYVSGGGFSLQSGVYVTLASGSLTYSEGISSGYRYGTIQDINYTTSYGISGCILSSAPCAPGDSGGIVAGNGNSSTRYVAGIITGSQGSTNYQISVKAVNILSACGVTVA